MEQLKIRLETETSLTPEQIEKALRTISPFDQEQILPLPTSEMEVKVRAMAAIPAKSSFSLKAGLRPHVETSSALPPDSPPPPPPTVSLPTPELNASALSMPPPLPPPALKAPGSPSLSAPASNTPPPALKAPGSPTLSAPTLKAPGSPSLTPPALKAPETLTAPSLQVPADQLAPIPGLASMGGGLRKKNLEGAPLQAPASLPPPPPPPSGADADVYVTSKVTPQIYAHKLGGTPPAPAPAPAPAAPAQSQNERTTVDLPPQVAPAEDPYLTAKVPSPQHLKSISGGAARAPEEAPTTAFKVDLSATQNSTVHPPSTSEQKPKTVPGVQPQVQEDGSVRFKGEFVFDKSAAGGSGNAKKMLPLIGFGVAALVFVAVVAVGIIKLSSPDKPALPNGKKPDPAAGAQPTAPVAVVEKPKLPPVQALPQNPRTSLCRLNFFHQQLLDAAVKDSIVNNGFRLELWAALDGLPSSECVLASVDGFSLGINKSGTVYASYPPAGIISASKPLAVRTEPGFPHTYYHLCIEADGKELSLYINGKLQDSSSFKTKTLPTEGMYSIGSPNPEPAVLVDEVLLTLSPKNTQGFVPAYPLVAAAAEDHLAAYMPLERSMPEIYFRTGKAPVTIPTQSWLDAADRLVKLQEILDEQKKIPPAAKVVGGRR